MFYVVLRNRVAQESGVKANSGIYLVVAGAERGSEAAVNTISEGEDVAHV